VIQPLLDSLTASTPIALGTRYGPGVSMSQGWPLYRRIISWGARILARPLTSASDPMTGFFAITKEQARLSSSRQQTPSQPHADHPRSLLLHSSFSPPPSTPRASKSRLNCSSNPLSQLPPRSRSNPTHSASVPSAHPNSHPKSCSATSVNSSLSTHGRGASSFTSLSVRESRWACGWLRGVGQSGS
jgi:hypothetical protein